MVSVGIHDPENFNNMYPEPPQNSFSSMPMDMGISPESYGQYPRHSHDPYPQAMSYDPNGAIFNEAAYHPIYTSGSSPGIYPDDGEIRVPSSNLSSTSGTPSAVGSPLSNPGQLAPIQEWAPQGLGVSPGIVDQSDYFPGSEYSFAPQGMEGFSQAYDFAAANSKPPGFVGELSQVPRSVSSRQRHAPHGSISSVSSAESCLTVVPEPGLALDTHMGHPSMNNSPVSTSASSRKSSLVFASPTVSSSSSFSSPPPMAWSSPCVDDLSPTARPRTPRLAPFFSQSSGHFVPPLETSYPSLIHPEHVRAIGMSGYDNAYPPQNATYPPTSPPLSASPQLRTGSASPFINNSNFQSFSPFPAPVDLQGRRQSLVSFVSNYSGEHPYSGDESKEKQRCPHPDCGKTFKDLKAHMLTHQTERPEKCPIATCDYHIKGFARKYDKNRHTLTHYKGTMVCGFCPGSGSAAEKSFNRADVFKRHLTAVHGVEQTPPNSRKKTAGGAGSAKKLTGYAPDATGKCSTCSQTFSNAQDFYEHLDDCVLRIVQQEDPAEAINAKRLAEVENDRDVHNTLEKNQLPTTTMTSNVEEDEDDDMVDDEDDEDVKGLKSSSPTKKNKGNPMNGVQKSRGLTHSRGGVPLPGKNRGRKNRRDYPSSWGFDKGQMTMKKRVMVVFDGPRRLAKDDMMLSTENEVRVKLSDGKAYVTDLDVQTLRRAEGFLGATDEEKGPWISDDPTEDELKRMLECNAELAA